MRRVTLQTLQCRETEDWGSDECRLELRTDGAHRGSLRRSLSNGQSWRLNRSFDVNDRLEVRLWDEDAPDADDHLGTVSLGGETTSGSTASFRRDGADYRLSYRVVDVPDRDPVADALDEFRRSSRPGRWPRIDRREFIADIERTLADPFSVRQRSTPLCGPAAIAFELARRNPERYVRMCRSLYEEGKFEARTVTIDPDQDLERSRIGGGMESDHWLLAASMRDAENAIFDVDADSNQFVMGVTTPWEMKGWIEEVLGLDDADYDSTYAWGEFEAMEKAHRVVRGGGVAFVMCHSDLLRGRSPTVGFPNHWIAYTGGLDIDEGVWWRHDSGHIRFDCFSWGRRRHVDVSEGIFEDGMWGLVTGE